MIQSHVITGGGRGVGRAIAEKLLSDGHAVVIVELASDEARWTTGHPAGARVVVVPGSADDPVVTNRAADVA